MSRSNPLTLGTELRFEKWSVTITEAERGDAALKAIKDANQFNEDPTEGFEYILVSLKLLNISKEQEAQNVLLGSDVRVTGDRNILYSASSTVSPKPLEGELFPEGSAEGQIAFQVPSDEKNLMFRVNEGFSFDGDAARFIAIDEGAKIEVSPDVAGQSANELGRDRTNPAKVGETVTTDVLQVTVLEVVRGEDAVKLITEANQFNEPAPEGQEYIAVKLKVRNVNETQPDQAELVDGNLLKATGEKQVVYDRPSAVAPGPQLDATLFPGGETEGWAVVAVAKGEQGISFVFEPLFSFSNSDTRYLAAQ